MNDGEAYLYARVYAEVCAREYDKLKKAAKKAENRRRRGLHTVPTRSTRGENISIETCHSDSAADAATAVEYMRRFFDPQKHV